MVDLSVSNEGSLYLLRPLTAEGKAWINEHTETEPWQWFGSALAVEPRYIRELVDGATADGLTVQ
jgi:hypothetical protein